MPTTATRSTNLWAICAIPIMTYCITAFKKKINAFGRENSGLIALMTGISVARKSIKKPVGMIACRHNLTLFS